MCKSFAESFTKYINIVIRDKDFSKYAAGFTNRKRREGILSDARSIRPVNISMFDRNKNLFNCKNGTFDFTQMSFRPHDHNDYITNMADVKFDAEAKCERWEQFINEIMCGDADTARFLQKALGYGLSGETNLECFFILYGSKTRNGKSTLMETIGNLMGDYSKTIQPQSLSKRFDNGASASPDMARLKGARLVNVAEPEKGLELNTALIKQLTGGDTYTGRLLYENSIEFKPEFKMYLNTNHLPTASDDTVFASERIKLIPFDRYFAPEEQDRGLKKFFQKPESRSAILNWLIEGYRLLQTEGLTATERIKSALNEYRYEADIFGSFLAEHTTEKQKNRLPVKDLYSCYIVWAKNNGYRQMNNKDFLAELSRRFEIKRNGNVGKVIIGIALFQSNGQPENEKVEAI